MTAQTLTDPARRRQLHKSLLRRNRFIDLLRLLVPALGVIILVGLLVQIYIAKVRQDFGVSNIRLEQDRLLIDTPRYEGVTENGTSYSVVAKTASTQLTQSDIIRLDTVTLDVTRPDGVSFSARAEMAYYDLLGQTVEVPGEAMVVDSRNTHALLRNSFVDWGAQTVDARGGADITFTDGTTLLAQTLIMYGDDGRWDMTGVTLETPEGEGTE